MTSQVRRSYVRHSNQLFPNNWFSRSQSDISVLLEDYAVNRIEFTMTTIFDDIDALPTTGYAQPTPPVSCVVAVETSAAATVVAAHAFPRAADLAGVALGAAGFAYFAQRARNHSSFDDRADATAIFAGDRQYSVSELTTMRFVGLD
jgi:hypothetical protein